MPVTPYNRRRRRRWIMMRLSIASATGGPAGVAPWSASDDFDRANGPLGVDWSILLGTAVIVTNAVDISVANTIGQWQSAPPSADYWAQAIVTIGGPTGNRMGPAIRITDSANYYALFVDELGSAVTLRKRVAGVNSTIQTYVTGATPFTLRLHAAATTLTATIDGIPQTPETDTDLAGTGAPGIFGDGSPFHTSRLDNWTAGNT